MTARQADRREQILSAAVRVFAKRGFHACRVSDIADEAGVAHELLDTIFLERWTVMLEVIRAADAEPVPVREKLYSIASFIVDSYRHDPDLMKVIIVEVTRAANSFGAKHLGEISAAFELIGEIVAKAQADGQVKPDVEARFAAMAFYGAIEQLLTGWIFGLLPRDDDYYEQAKTMVVETIFVGLEAPAAARLEVG